MGKLIVLIIVAVVLIGIVIVVGSLAAIAVRKAFDADYRQLRADKLELEENCARLERLLAQAERNTQ